MNLASSYLPPDALSFRARDRMAEYRARQLQFACYAISPARWIRADTRRDSVLRPPRCASIVVVGIPLGRDRARDGRHAQLLLADDQRARLLRQAARLILARTFLDTVYRRPQRGCYAPAQRDRRTPRSGGTHAPRATPLRRSHRVTLRRHPGDQF